MGTSADTWSTKNTALMAMTMMLACTSRGLATCPMEGIDAGGVRRALNIPRGRYSIPLIVSTGKPYNEDESTSEDGADDVGMNQSPRFPFEDVVYGNSFG